MEAHQSATDDVAKIILTFKFRLRDKHSSELNRQAKAVNYVWNYCNNVQQKAVCEARKWHTGFDLCNLTAGSGQILDIHSHTVKRVCQCYDSSRKARKKPWLKFRGNKALGWVPFNTAHVTFDGEAFVFRKTRYKPMHMRKEIKRGGKILAGSFNQDARGHWYINVPVEMPISVTSNRKMVGIDLGLKSFATLSDGEAIEAPKFYRASEKALATAQRARKTPKRVRNIHAKIANRRKDFLHKETTKLAAQYTLIVVGDVSSNKLAKTKMAKSVFDASWSSFKSMLAYKTVRQGGGMIEADERWTTQTCSCCGALPPERPRGIAGLGIREWKCGECGTTHDRDVNAAKNILRVGQHALAEGAAVTLRGMKVASDCYTELPHGEHYRYRVTQQ